MNNLIQIEGDSHPDHLKQLVEKTNNSKDWKAYMAPRELKGDINFHNDAKQVGVEFMKIKYVPDPSAIAIGTLEDGVPMLYNRNQNKIIAIIENDCIRLLDGAIGCGELDAEDIQVLRAFFDMVVPEKI